METKRLIVSTNYINLHAMRSRIERERDGRMIENVRRETVKTREREERQTTASLPYYFLKSQQQLQHHVTINVELEKHAPMRINCIKYHFTFSLMNRRRPYNV